MKTGRKSKAKKDESFSGNLSALSAMNLSATSGSKNSKQSKKKGGSKKRTDIEKSNPSRQGDGPTLNQEGFEEFCTESEIIKDMKI